MRGEPSILHVDLDAMFAAVEQRDKPSLRGKPVIVGGVAGRGVVSTASYEARAFGARSAMPTAQARRLCPLNTAFLSPRFAAYQRTSVVVMELLAGVSPLVEQVSIDEAYVDLAPTGRDLSLAAVTDLALRLKAEIAVATGGVTGSIGAASSKLLAKIGSDLNKPDGLTIVPAGQELAVLHPLPVRRLGGVGPATELRLHRAGVRTVGDLAARSLDDLVDWFGTAHGHGLHRLARAEDNRPVVSEREAKSVSAEETFDVDLTDPARLQRELDLLAGRVAGRLRRSGLTGRTVNIKVRHPDFTTITRAVTRDQPTDDGVLIAQLARRLLSDVPTAGGIRLLGVGVSTLYDFAQDDLFTAAGEDPPDYDPTPPLTSLPSAAFTWPSGAGVTSPPDAGATSSSPDVASTPSPGPAAPQAFVSPPGSAVSAGVAVSGGSAVPGDPAVSADPAVSTGPAASTGSAGSAGHAVMTGVDASGESGVSDYSRPSGMCGQSAHGDSPGASASSAHHPPLDTISNPDGPLPPRAGSDLRDTTAMSSAGVAPGPIPASVRPPADALVRPPADVPVRPPVVAPMRPPADTPVWRPGQDVRHDEHGPGWVQGSGIGRVTVRFEGPLTPVGRVRTFFVDDPLLHPADPPDWSPAG